MGNLRFKSSSKFSRLVQASLATIIAIPLALLVLSLSAMVKVAAGLVSLAFRTLAEIVGGLISLAEQVVLIFVINTAPTATPDEKE